MLNAKLKGLLALIGIACACMLMSCGNRPDTGPNAPTSIVITAPSGSVASGGTMQFSAKGIDPNGDTVDVTPVWSVVNGGGTITSDGLFTAGSTAGTFANTIRACVGTVCTTTTVVITAPLPTLTSITLTPATDSVAVDLTSQFTAVGRDQDGNVIAFTPTWSVVAGGGTVSSTGLFTAGTVAGSFAQTVRVSSGAIADSSNVVVMPGPLASIAIMRDTATFAIHDTLTYTAVGHDAHGNVVAITPVWSVVGGGGAFSGATFTADTVAGVFMNAVHATVGLISSTSSVTVLAGALSGITVSPADPVIMTIQTAQFTASGHDAYGNAVAISSPIWGVISSAKGTISPGGLYTPGQNLQGQGHFVNAITATSDGFTGYGSVTVMCDASCS